MFDSFLGVTSYLYTYSLLAAFIYVVAYILEVELGKGIGLRRRLGKRGIIGGEFIVLLIITIIITHRLSDNGHQTTLAVDTVNAFRSLSLEMLLWHGYPPK